MTAAQFLDDLARVPDALRGLAAALADVRASVERSVAAASVDRVLLAGMGSSWFAAQIAAARLRAAGVNAVAELSSTASSWPDGPGLLSVPISASGGSIETLDLAGRLQRTLAITNTPGSALVDATAHHALMHAGPEDSGVACRSYRHTIAVLAVLEEVLTGSDLGLHGRLLAAADASAELLDTIDGWLPEVAEVLGGGAGLWTLAPWERIGSALQGALMVRECPRRIADGCETGDWSHVDVYLTKTMAYRALVFTGSRYDDAAARWMTERAATAVAVGGDFAAARATVRHRHDDDPFVRALVEVLVPELVAQRWWAAAV